jgi:hypothetical protein
MPNFMNNNEADLALIMNWWTRLGVLLCGLFFVGCTSEEKFPPIGDRIVSPVDVGVSDDGQFFYVLNSDFDRTYNVGSIVTIDKNGEKKGVIEVPRMGRNLVVAGNDLLVTMDRGPLNEPPRVQLYDLSKDPLLPELKADFQLECSPFGAALRKNYQHFAVSCIEGQIYLGTLNEDRGQSTLKLVRQYAVPRRALYIDPVRELLLGFVTDPQQNGSKDAEYADATRYDASAKEVLGPNGTKLPNEIPDVMESKLNGPNLRGQKFQYTYIVYDIASERDKAPDCKTTETENCVFPYRPNNKATVQQELRMLYFKLRNLDGTPDQSPFGNDPSYKYYRTNFWEAKHDPDDPNVFYLSHRNAPDKSPHANQIVQVNIVGDLRVQDKKEPPQTGEVLKFERIYGFNGPESDKRHFPGDFEVQYVQGFKSLVVNHFKDVLNWSRKDQYFSLAAKTFTDNAWSSEIEGALTKDSILTYYQLALNSEGRLISCSFYGNFVQLLEMTPGVGFKEIKNID